MTSDLGAVSIPQISASIDGQARQFEAAASAAAADFKFRVTGKFNLKFRGNLNLKSESGFNLTF